MLETGNGIIRASALPKAVRLAAYILRRLWQMVPTLAGVILFVFFLFKFFGGDPAEILGGDRHTEQITRSKALG